MAFTFINMSFGYDDSAGATVDTSASLNVTEGDLLIAFAYVTAQNPYERTTFAIAKNSGTPTNAFTFDAADENLSHEATWGGQSWMGYKIAANADATATFRLTFGVSVPKKGFFVAQFRPDSSETVTKDASNKSGSSGTSITSGNITTTGTDEVVVGAANSYNYETKTDLSINGTAATEPTGSPLASSAGRGALWYRILTGTFTDGAATGTLSASEWWNCNIIAFKSEGGAGRNPVPMGFVVE